jgi:hypothetical protein
MRGVTRIATFLGLALAATIAPSRALASSIDAQGNLVWESDALLTFGFESLADATAVGAAWTTWGTATDGRPVLLGTSVNAASLSQATVTGSQALEGSFALQIASGSTMALALLDTTFFKTIGSRRIAVSMWGRAFGAEPELDVVFPSSDQSIGPDGFGHIIAVRTGNETSDGWVQYSTGPIDGSLFGEPIGAIIVTARVATTGDTVPLDSVQLAPGQGGPTVMDASATAVVDAVEVDPVTGPLVGGQACTQATIDTACGPAGECTYGVCVDGAVVWGAVPPVAGDRQQLVQRVELGLEHQQAARDAADAAPSILTSSFLSATEGATQPRAFYGALNEAVAGVRNGHTTLGSPLASFETTFYPLINPWGNPWSGFLDVCLGPALDDLPGATGASTYAVYWIASGSAVSGMLHVGDMLTAVDGMAPDAWLTLAKARYSPMLPDDPTSEPTGRGIMFADMLSKYAQTATFSSCTAAGACTPVTVNPAQIAQGILNGTAYKTATAFSRACSPRFVDSVSAWTSADDDTAYDTPQYATVGTVTSIEFDGFEGAYDSSDPSDPYHAWWQPFASAFAAGNGLLVDARQGHGGLFLLGSWLAEQIRGTSSPYYAYAAPRGDYDLADPTWLFDPSLAACLGVSPSADTMCGWLSGGDSDESTLASPPAGGLQIAWVNGNDLSMNDITPEKLKGAPNVRIFGPHPTTGALGEITDLPPIEGPWLSGSLQTLDMRFGASFTAAVASPWASGTGVAPDQIVTQKVSDLLAGQDTVLEAAKTWLGQ